MESMYQQYRDIAEFRLVYITEAHAADSNWPVAYAEEKNITQHDNYEERCATADMLISDKELTIPTLIDDMENSANRLYQAHPDRIFVVRSDGTLAVAAEPGPFGFKPALAETARWLAALRETGKELEKAPPDPNANKPPKPHGLSEDDLNKIVGTWKLTLQVGERSLPVRLIVRDDDGVFTGEWTMFEETSRLEDITFDGSRFVCEIGMGGSIDFEATVEDGTMNGSIAAGSADVTGTRIE